MDARRSFQIRAGLLALAAYGLVSVVGILIRGANILPTDNPDGFARQAVNATHHLGWIILVFGPLLQALGLFGLYALLNSGKTFRSAFWGLVLSIAGICLYLPLLGISAFIDPLVGKQFNAGDTGAMEISKVGMFQGAGLAIILLSVGCLIAGSVALGIAIWDGAARLPKWTVPLYVIHAILLTFGAQFAYALEITGAVFALLSCAGLAWAGWKVTQPTEVGGAVVSAPVGGSLA